MATQSEAALEQCLIDKLVDVGYEGIKISNKKELENLKTQSFETEQRLDCDLYLIQDTRGNEKIEPGPDWKLIWSGKRASERRESFRLFQHT
jgi:hypothetical protein